MADSNDTTPPRFAELKARVAALGHKLLHDVSGEMYILDDHDEDFLLAVNVTEETIEREIEGLKEVHEDDEDQTAPAHRSLSDCLGDGCLALYELDALLHTLLGIAMSSGGMENDRGRSVSLVNAAQRSLHSITNKL